MNKTIKIVILLIALFILVISCEKNTNPDTTPPNVTITNPQDGLTVFELTFINSIATDNDKINKVELWVDGVATEIIDETEPYSFVWDTTIYEDESIHTITVRAYDESENMTDSESITLIVNNSNSYPTQINLNLIEYSYNNHTFLISWNKSPDIDFYNYQLSESLSKNMSNMELIFSSNAIEDTTYTVSGVKEDEIRFYQLVVTDTIGYSSSSSIQIASSFIMFNYTYGDGYGYSVQPTNDKGYVIVGTSNSDILLLKVDYYGNEEWRQYFGGSSGEWGQSVRQTTDNGYIIVGYTNSYGAGLSDIWLIKTDLNGFEEWNQTFGGNGTDKGYSVCQTSDGGYVITGAKEEVVSGPDDVWLIKTDENGNEEWNQLFGDSDNQICRSVIQTNDNGFIITGYGKEQPNTDWRLLLIKVDMLGNIEWDNYFGGSDSDYGYEVKQTDDGGFIITGMTYSFGNDDEDILLLKTYENGNEEWYHAYGGPSNNSNYDGHYGESVEQTSDGGYIITGVCYSSIEDNTNMILIKTDNLGNLEWNKSYGNESPDNNEFGRSIIQTLSGGYVITGSKSGELWLIKTNQNG
ncbi:MAG: Ig-like domain-containing protein [Candidatus Cloacimonetes bacterium]|nr:Ig-like domain-containing protein [Candidatus Cloacimonadota bacterium]